MKRIGIFLLLCFLPALLSAGSLRLHNDSPFKLRAVIRAADGTYLGEMVILPEHFNTWSSDYPSFGPGGQNYSENPTRSMTPYTVYWYCLSGGVYGISPNKSPGEAVMAKNSEGPRMCQPQKKRKGQSPYGAKEGDEQLFDQNDAGSPPNIEN
ncbi:MAG: hypothetical protein KR126chlam1_00499 [Chlamydiae bacterium]|nr:hypothetical protein [Chlamydiota bacterium]